MDTVETVNGGVELIEQIILLQVEVCIKKVITLVLSVAEGRIDEIFLPLTRLNVGRPGGQSDRFALSNFVW